MLDIGDRFRNFRQRSLEPTQVEQLKTDLLEESTPNVTYLILIVSSCAIATFGLLTNSAAVIIGAMIIAPLMLPIRGLAFGALAGNVKLFRQGIIAVVIGTLMAVAIAYSLGSLVGISNFGSEVLSRSKPTLLDLGIAVVAGAISGYAKVQPKISASLAGTAIAVALMPPVCVIGLGLSQANWSLSQGATLLYLTNLLGITLACMLTFFIVGYSPLKRARTPLIWTLTLTGVLLIPLSVSFSELVRQARLESSLRKVLLNRTVTFQRLNLVKSDTNWLTNPPQVRLSVRAKEPVTPKQVRLLEAFLAKEMGRPFKLIFEVSQVEEIIGSTTEYGRIQQKLID
ncbi:DUF389 domain-containing protein [Hassallia byssoidea VB512170]|uniref:DUF389 domain-containing protein n=1 Tax=Hassallia byssoidea VB512170 TaxID=1304833 RepID=A0A846HJ30_9CYAN|nr:DUF389 domain-containing protein [Hassalia byssoidea]NEU77355.1 DUF389 domain-containing protein [Hassalia byssoidea VB512170]